MGKNKDKSFSSELDGLEGASAPAASGWTAGGYLGKLHIVRPIEKGKMDTSTGPDSEYVKADVVVLDENGDEHEVHANTLIWGKMLRVQLEGPLDRKTRLVGRLGQGAKQPGKTPAFIFEDATERDFGHARRFLSSANPL